MRPALLLGSIALITAGLLFLTNYDPLCHGQCTGSGGVQGIGEVRVDDLGSFTAPDGDHFTAVRVHHQPGGRFRFLFTLSNEGPVGVTITGIGYRATKYSRFRVVDVRLGFEGASVAEQPFRPFSLARGSREFANVWVTLQMQGCRQVNSLTHLGAVPITYRVLGFTRHTTVHLPESIEIAGTQREPCV